MSGATAFETAFVRKGVHPRDVQFDIAIAAYLNSGGTIAGAQDRLNAAAARMPNAGQVDHGRDAHMDIARVRQQVEGDTAPTGYASNRHFVDGPSPSFNRGRESHSSDATSRPRPALPVREPTPQQRSIGARNARVFAVSILDRVKTTDGRPWGDVGAHELDGMARDGALAIAVKRRIGVLSNSQRFKPIRELLDAAAFEAVYNDSKETV